MKVSCLRIFAVVGVVAACSDGGAMPDRSAAFAFPTYDVVNLSSRVVADSVVFVAMNDSGGLAGNRFVQGAWHGFLLDGATLTDLPCLASGMNASSDITCLVENRPNLWHDGVLTQLLDDSVVVASARLTDSGVVYGTTLGGRPWRSINGSYETLVFGVSPGAANDRGDVPVTSGETYPTGFVWYAELGPTTVLTSWGRYSRARAINNAGDLVGAAERQPGQATVAVVARKANGYRTDSIGSPQFTTSIASFINNHDVILGNGTAGLFLMHGSDIAPLNDLTPSPIDIAAVPTFTDGGRILVRAKPYVSGVWLALIPK